MAFRILLSLSLFAFLPSFLFAQNSFFDHGKRGLLFEMMTSHKLIAAFHFILLVTFFTWGNYDSIFTERHGGTTLRSIPWLAGIGAFSLTFILYLITNFYRIVDDNFVNQLKILERIFRYSSFLFSIYVLAITAFVIERLFLTVGAFILTFIFVWVIGLIMSVIFIAIFFFFRKNFDGK